MKFLVNTFVLLLLCSSVAVSQVLTVNTRHDVVDPGDGLLSLREAIDSAKAVAGPNVIGFDAMFADPDSLILLDSTLVIDDPDSLVIDGAEVITMAPNPLLDGVRFNGMVIRSGNFTVKNLTFTDIRGVSIIVDTVRPEPAAVMPMVVIGPKNNIVNSEENAIWIINSTHVIVTENVVLNSGWWGYSDGILITDSTSNIEITDNIIMQSYSSGVASFHSGPLTISRNYIGRNMNSGILVEGGTEGGLAFNSIVGNSLDGISVRGGNGHSISNNSIGDSTAVIQVPTLANALAGMELTPMRAARTDIEAPFLQQPPHRKIGPTRPERRSLPRTRELAPRTPPQIPLAAAATADHVGNGGNGISVYGTTDTQIRFNLIYGSQYTGIFLDSWSDEIEIHYPTDILIEANRIERSGDAQIWFYQTGPVTIHNNTLQSSGNGIIGGEYYYGGGESAAPFSATTSATVQAVPSSIISITLNYITNNSYGQGVYLYGVDSAYVAKNRIMNQYSGIYLYEPSRALVEWNEVSNVQEYAFDAYTSGKIWVQDNKFENAYYGVYAEGNYEGSGDIIVARNHISSISYYRVQVYGFRDAVIENNTVTGGSYYTGIDAGYTEILRVTGNNGPSLYVYDTDSVVVEKNAIRGQYNDNSIYLQYVNKALVSDNSIGDGSGGVYFSNVDSLWVWNNEILQSKYAGISVYSTLFAHVWENDVYGHQDAGMYLSYVDSAVVERNNITGNQSSGVETYYNNGILIKNNTILENLNAGVSSYADTVIAIEENFIALNQSGFDIWYTTTASLATGNTFFRNLNGSNYYGAIQFLNAEGNYWGDASGPRDLADTDGLGITNNGSGDHVSEQIDWDPFLEAPSYLSEARPDIAEITPPHSARPGGIPAVLKGRQFLPGMTLMIGEANVQFDYVTSDLVTFMIPPGPGGPVHVVVTNANGKADTLFKGFKYDNNSPFPFNLVSPVEEATVSSAPQFVWHAALDPDGDALKYIVEYAPVITFDGSVRMEPTADTTLWLSTAALSPSTTYYWRVIATDGREGIASSPVSTFQTDVILSVEGPQALPTTFAMDQNYPNPFNPETVIRFQLPATATVSLKVFDLLGREVATLVDDMKPAGFYTVSWNGRNTFGQQASSGVYFFRIEAGSFVETRRMLLVR